MNIETVCVHGTDSSRKPNEFGAVSVPIYQSATFSHPSLGVTTGFDYTRQSNPTRQALEDHLSSLEGLTSGGTCAFSSGMAAFSAVMDLFSSGSHILAADDLYGGSIRMFDLLKRQRGIDVSYFSSGETAEDITRYLRPATRAVFIETLSNPLMNVFDIRRIAEAFHAHGILLIVDNTFMTPYFQRPFELGADIVIHSGSKYLGGHNDTIAGFVSARTDDLYEKLQYISKTTGAALAPFDSWLILRGLKTLALRMEKVSSNAAYIASFLQTHPHVQKVYYPGLVNFPRHDICRSQSSGFSGMISFTVDSPQRAASVLSSVNLIQFAESLGGTESLITYPFTQTHADIPLEERMRRGITDTLLRLSCGIESAQDIAADLDQALNNYTA